MENAARASHVMLVEVIPVRTAKKQQEMILWSKPESN